MNIRQWKTVPPVSVHELQVGLRISVDACMNRFDFAFINKKRPDQRRHDPEDLHDEMVDRGLIEADEFNDAISGLVKRGLVEITADGLALADNEYTRVLCAIRDSFPGAKGLAIFERLQALQFLHNRKEFRKWVRDHGGGKIEYADALIDAAAYWPIDIDPDKTLPNTACFRKGFAKEIQRVADKKYGGQFT